MTNWPAIADALAAPLRNVPCTCRRVGEWPIFQAKDKATTCARCSGLAVYDEARAPSTKTREGG